MGKIVLEERVLRQLVAHRLPALELAAAGIDAAGWRALPGAVARGQGAAFSGWSIPRVVDALQKLCHDAMVLAVGGVPRYFPSEAVQRGAKLESLVAWSRSLNRVARHDEHPWNEGLSIEALVCEGQACWQEATSAAAGARRPLDTLKQ